MQILPIFNFNAFKFSSRDLLSEYRSSKENKAKKFTDCALLHPNCTFPQKSVKIKKRNGVQDKKIETTTEGVEESLTEIPDVVAKYVKSV